MATIVRSTGVALDSGWWMSKSTANGAISRRGRAILLSPLHPAEATPGEAAVQGQVVDGVQLEDEAEVLVHEAQPASVAVRAVAELGDVDRFTVEPRLGAGSGVW